jgi:uracil-DNA glycosylase family 4
MDERSLGELELLAVARLYQLEARNLEARGTKHETQEVAGEAAGAQSREVSLVPHASRLMPSLSESGWDELRKLAAACTACGLCRQRKQAVFGVGNESAPWLFVGEGPGADEDEQGEPFVGQAGRLLDSMLAAIGCERGREVYIANVVKCRPPGNRVPTAEEGAACAPFLDRQIDLIRPKLIVALGKTAAVRLLATEASVASLRGKVHRYRDIPVVVTYHPAYLLRTLPEKAKAWEDLLFARRTLRATA